MAKAKSSKTLKSKKALASPVKPKSAGSKSARSRSVKTGASKKVSSKPLVKNSQAKSPAKKISQEKKVPSKAKPKTEAVRTTPIKKLPRNMVAVSGIVGLSTEEGVFLVASTEQGKEELFDFRMAVKEPFPRAVNVGASKCVRAREVVADTSTQPARQLYLSFIAVPSGLQVEGNLLYRARTEKREEVFFSAPTQKYQSLEADKVTRVLAVLSTSFQELMPRILGKEHVLTQQLMVILRKKAEIEFWNATQKSVKDLLQAGQSERALGVLEPLVFCAKPHLQAEKLLGELLYSSAKKADGAGDGPGQVALRGLTTETLMVQWLLRKAEGA